MGSQASAFMKENNLILYKIMMVLLLSCTNDNNYDISSSSSSSSFLLSPYQQQHNNPPQAQAVLSSLPIDGHFKFDNIEYAAKDFGGTSHFLPLAVLHPKSVSDISTTVKYVFDLGPTSEVTVAARGHAHSLQGQAQALGGVVVTMESLELKIRVCKGKVPYVEVSGGELWIDILRQTLKYGLAPKSWTDYLYLTVGGTLSNAGISGQAFRHGPQINNVYELEVITGKGEIVTCSVKHNSDLFYGVLGGLGQFGVITKARISLGPAANRVYWIRLVYDDFSLFTTDQEHLISLDDAFDYVEGFVLINRTGLVNSWRSSFNPKHPHEASQFKSEGLILYCLEVAMYFNPEEYEAVTQKTERLLSKLSYIPCIIFTSEVSLIEFLDRVHVSEVRLHAKGLWEVPHPWLNLMVPRSKVADFAKAVFGNIVTDNANGPILLYPVDKSRWDNRTSLVTPDEDIIYLVAFLSSAIPDSKGKDGLEHILARNRKVMEFCGTMIPGIKQYLPHYNTREEWKTHYGAKWEVFVRRKLEYDPLKILAPGQRIFPKRIPIM